MLYINTGTTPYFAQPFYYMAKKKPYLKLRIKQ